MRRRPAGLERLGAESAEASLPAAVVLQSVSETLLIEVRPQAIAEMQFRERAFPEQKVAEAPLASGANQQVDGACGIRAMIDFVQQAVKILGIEVRGAAGPPRGLHYAVLRGVVDRYAQEHSRAGGARPLALLNGPKQVLAEAIAPADHVDSYRLLDTAACLGEQVLAKQAH